MRRGLRFGANYDGLRLRGVWAELPSQTMPEAFKAHEQTLQTVFIHDDMAAQAHRHAGEKPLAPGGADVRLRHEIHGVAEVVIAAQRRIAQQVYAHKANG